MEKNNDVDKVSSLNLLHLFLLLKREKNFSKEEEEERIQMGSVEGEFCFRGELKL